MDVVGILNEVQKTLGVLLEAIRHEPILSGLVVLALFPFVRSFLLSSRISRLLKGTDGKSLEGTIHALGKRVSALEKYAAGNTEHLNDIERRLVRAVQSVAVERFDPFGERGGQQSFATALLNERGDGVVISGIHARDSVRVYAKRVKNFTSEHELSEEEARAIQTAQKDIGSR